MFNVNYIRVPFTQAVNTFNFSDNFFYNVSISGSYGPIPYGNDNFDIYNTGGGQFSQLFFSGSGFWNGSGYTVSNNYYLAENFDNYLIGWEFSGVKLVKGQDVSGYNVSSGNITGIVYGEPGRMLFNSDKPLTNSGNGAVISGVYLFTGGLLNQSSGVKINYKNAYWLISGYHDITGSSSLQDNYSIKINRSAFSVQQNLSYSNDTVKKIDLEIYLPYIIHQNNNEFDVIEVLSIYSNFFNQKLRAAFYLSGMNENSGIIWQTYPNNFYNTNNDGQIVQKENWTKITGLFDFTGRVDAGGIGPSSSDEYRFSTSYSVQDQGGPAPFVVQGFATGYYYKVRNFNVYVNTMTGLGGAGIAVYTDKSYLSFSGYQDSPLSLASDSLSNDYPFHWSGVFTGKEGKEVLIYE